MLIFKKKLKRTPSKLHPAASPNWFPEKTCRKFAFGRTNPTAFLPEMALPGTDPWLPNDPPPLAGKGLRISRVCSLEAYDFSHF
jgi:hypothetical protein